MDKFEGLGFTTVDEALQGQVAGLDIIATSGNLGSGSTMRLRGASSLSSLTNENPLIVVDGNTWNVDMSNFDLASANDEKFAELLNINPEDIASGALPSPPQQPSTVRRAVTVLSSLPPSVVRAVNRVSRIRSSSRVRISPKVTICFRVTTTPCC